jgi:hypothetical protein
MRNTGYPSPHRKGYRERVKRPRLKIGLVLLSAALVLWAGVPTWAQPPDGKPFDPEAAGSDGLRGQIPYGGEIEIAVTIDGERDPAVTMCAFRPIPGRLCDRRLRLRAAGRPAGQPAGRSLHDL